MNICAICKDPKKETRPYGKDGSEICFPCMQATPEREAEAKRQLEKAFRKAGSGPSLLTNRGPVPLAAGSVIKGKKS